MIKVKVLKQFHDKETDQLYTVGEVIEVTDDRAREILSSPLSVAELADGEKLPEQEKPRRGKKDVE